MNGVSFGPVGAALVVVCLFIGLAMWGANRSAYYPSAYPQGDWSRQQALGFQDVRIRTADGVLLHAWYLPGTFRWATLFLHGNAGNVTHRANAMQAIGAAGSAVLVVDYRGFGKSVGRPTERGLYRDAEAAYRSLQSLGWQPHQIILHGESLGTAVATDLATRVTCAGLILESPFPSARAVAQAIVPVLGPLLVWGWETKAKVARVRVPVLVIHGDRDEIIPQALGRQVFEAANPPKQLWSIEGAGHNDLLARAGAGYARRLRSFYESLPEQSRKVAQLE